MVQSGPGWPTQQCVDIVAAVLDYDGGANPDAIAPFKAKDIARCNQGYREDWAAPGDFLRLGTVSASFRLPEEWVCQGTGRHRPGHDPGYCHEPLALDELPGNAPRCPFRFSRLRGPGGGLHRSATQALHHEPADELLTPSRRRAKRIMNMSTIFRRLPALAVAALVAWTTGCGIATQVMGITADDDIAEAYLMPTLAHGANLELSHVFFSTTGHPGLFFTAPTDEVTGGRNNDGMRRRWTVNQYHERQDATYSQTNEAGSVAAYSAERMKDVNKKEGTDPDDSPDRPHVHQRGLQHAGPGGKQCVAGVGWGPEGGSLLPGPDRYDNTVVVDADSIMVTAITWAEMAGAQAERAIAAGRLNEYEADWEHFIPQNSLYASHAIRARAYLWLEDYTRAAEHAAMVPTDFVWNLYSHEENSWRNIMVYYTQHYAQLTVWGSAIGTTFHDVDDPEDSMDQVR